MSTSRFERNQGILPDIEIKNQLRIAYDPVHRNAGDPACILYNREYRQLRMDNDRRDKERYENMHAHDEDDWGDFRMYSMNRGAGFALASCTSDEKAEQYLEMFPNLVDKLFHALDSMKDDSAIRTLTTNEIEHLNNIFNYMAHAVHTDNIDLNQRISGLVKESQEFQATLKYLKQSLDSYTTSLAETSEMVAATGTVPNNFMGSVLSLESILEDFEFYSTAMTLTARRLGRLTAQQQLDKMLNVMILNIRAIRTVRDNHKKHFDRLQKEFALVKKLLKDNNIPFTNISEDIQQNGDNNNFPAGHCRSMKNRLKYLEKKSNFLNEGYDFVRREIFWPWNREVSIHGFKQGISILLMFTGILVYIWRFFPYLFRLIFVRKNI